MTNVSHSLKALHIHHFHMSHNPFCGGKFVYTFDCRMCLLGNYFAQMGNNDSCCAPNCSNRINRQWMMDFGIMDLPLKYHGLKGYSKTLMQGGKLYQNACLVTSVALPFYLNAVAIQI